MKNTEKRLPYQEASIEVISMLGVDIITTSVWNDDDIDSDGWT